MALFYKDARGKKTLILLQQVAAVERYPDCGVVFHLISGSAPIIRANSEEDADELVEQCWRYMQRQQGQQDKSNCLLVPYNTPDPFLQPTPDFCPYTPGQDI